MTETISEEHATNIIGKLVLRGTSLNRAEEWVYRKFKVVSNTEFKEEELAKFQRKYGHQVGVVGQ